MLAHNAGSDLIRAVDSLRTQGWDDEALEIVVIDNASTDGSTASLRSDPRVRLIERDDNPGFAAHNPLLTDTGGADAVLLLNPDAELGPNALDRMVAMLASDAALGAVVPKVLFTDDMIEVELGVGNGAGRDVSPRFLRAVAEPAASGSAETAIRVQLHTADGQELPDDRLPPGTLVRLRMPTPHCPVRLAIEDKSGVGVTAALCATADLGDSSDSESAGDRESMGAGRPVGGDVPLVRSFTPSRDSAAVTAADTAAHDGHSSVVIDMTHSTGRAVVNGAGLRLLPDGRGADRGVHQFDEGQFDEPTDVVGWSGGAVLLAADYLADVGAFEPSFFLYYEDLDLSLRGRRKGWRYRTAPTAVVRHRRGGSTGIGSALVDHQVERNRLWVLARHAPPSLGAREWMRHPLISLSYLRSELKQAAKERRRPDLTTSRRRSRAFLAALAGLPKALGARRDFDRNCSEPAWPEPGDFQ